MRLRTMLAAVAIAAALPATAALSPGVKAPDFATRGALAGKKVDVRLADALRKGPVVLYFFPAAYTGGCNQEAHDFSEAMPQFRAAGATVIGMSTDTVDRLVRFSQEKCAGQFTVASAGPRVVKAYDVALDRMIPDVETKRMRAVTNRTSYVIARDGRIAFVHSDLAAADHVRLTLQAVRALK